MSGSSVYTKDEKILVAYFSRTGNTETLAGYIKELTGGDLFEIITTTPYPLDYSECVAQASRELAADFRPVFSACVENMEQCSTIFIGYPIWHGNTPMPVRSFLEDYNFDGKILIPFSASGSSEKRSYP